MFFFVCLSVWWLFIFGSWWEWWDWLSLRCFYTQAGSYTCRYGRPAAPCKWGAWRHLLGPARTCKNHKRWGLENIGSCQINIHFAQSTFYHPLCFMEITGPLHFSSSGLPSPAQKVDSDLPVPRLCSWWWASLQFIVTCKAWSISVQKMCPKYPPISLQVVAVDSPPNGQTAAPASAERLGLWFAGLCLLPDWTGCCGVNLGGPWENREVKWSLLIENAAFFARSFRWLSWRMFVRSQKASWRLRFAKQDWRIH